MKSKKLFPVFMFLILSLVFLFACSKESPVTPPPTNTPTATLTATIDSTSSITPTSTPTATLTATASATSTITVTPTSTHVIVTFPDSNLESAIRTAISKPSGDITEDDLSVLTTFFDDSGSITNLSGIEHCKNLTNLGIQYSGSITDISMLSTMTQLTSLDLYGATGVTDASALSTLTNLQTLNLGHGGNYPVALTGISTIASLTLLTTLELMDRDIDNTDAALLSSLVNMFILNLSRNSFDNTSFMTNMSSLGYLSCNETAISDLSGLSGLLNLTSVSLSGCTSLTDISSLVTNAAAGGLGNGDNVYLTGDTLSAQGVIDVGTLQTTYSVTVTYP